MRLFFTTMILTMLVQSVWAEGQLDQNEIREIIATTTNESVASALAACLTQENADTEDVPYCYCALKHRDVKTEAGFEILYEDCTAPYIAALLEDFLEGMRKVNEPTPPIEPKPPISISDILDLRDHVAKCWQPPIHAAGDEDLTVGINVQIDEQGNVLSASVEDKKRFALDSVFKANAIAAKRSIIECSPLPISPEQRGNLRQFIFSFNPAFLQKK